MKLNVKAFALTCGIIWATGVLFLTWWLILLEGSEPSGCFLNRIYKGYTMTPVGSLIGMVWGFFDAGIGGAVFAWMYNLLVGKLTKTQ